MNDLEIPVGRRTRLYRFFEMVPALLSYGAIVLLLVLSIVSPVLTAIYLLLIVMTLLVKAVGTAIHMLRGHHRVGKAGSIHWHEWLTELERPEESWQRLSVSAKRKHDYFQTARYENLALVASNPQHYPKPSEIYNALIIATYNESLEILEETLRSVIDTTYEKSRLIVILTYEERGGVLIEDRAKKLQKKFASELPHFFITKHPANIEGEVKGKGANITWAGHYLREWIDKERIAHDNVIVTTLDSDNHPHKTYFDYLTYEFIIHDNRHHLSFQPVSLFLNNIWDVPAPMRVVATGNSFWNIISAMRPHALRNFASHSQPLSALVGMDFWSKRTIVEDGHQYWRSYFYFNGEYDVIPLFVPIYQDAVLSDTYVKTLKAQFGQLRRWAYGASDVPYVAVRIFSRHREVPFFAGLARLVRLIDGHVTLACIPFLVTFGGWVPLFVNGEALRSVAANQLPEVLGVLQRVAMIGLIVMVFLSFRMLPPRPARYKRHRNFLMVAQWVLMPVTAICYSAISAFYSQTRLFLGKYMDVFEVTDKATATPPTKKL
ncbi:MAG: glycosyltransferase [Candidatus Saccharimonadales bacterium]